jgi:hypothetical protein
MVLIIHPMQQFSRGAAQGTVILLGNQRLRVTLLTQPEWISLAGFRDWGRKVESGGGAALIRQRLQQWLKRLRKNISLLSPGIKTLIHSQGGHRRARSAAPAKIAVFPQPVNLAALRAGTRYFGHP